MAVLAAVAQRVTIFWVTAMVEDPSAKVIIGLVVTMARELAQARSRAGEIQFRITERLEERVKKKEFKKMLNAAVQHALLERPWVNSRRFSFDY